MNAAHWHLMINHIPVLGSLFALLLWLVALKKNQADFFRLGIGWIVTVGLLTIPVYVTGTQGHDVLHGMPGVALENIDLHEQWGTLLSGVILITALLAVGAAASARHRQGTPGKVWRALITVFLLIASLLGAYTAHVGGQIHHPEMRPDFQPVPEAPHEEIQMFDQSMPPVHRHHDGSEHHH